MKETTVYVPADSEDYAGYTTHILVGTSTSDISVFTLMEDKVVHGFDQAAEEEAKEYNFPESREERFLDQNLQEFYKKKGYKI